jgi:hypothetical protein
MNRSWTYSLAASFSGSYGVSGAIISGFEVKRWQFVVYSLASACLVAVIQLGFLYQAKRRMQRFFGLTSQSPVNIAISSYWNVSEYDESRGEEKNMRYYKHDGVSGARTFLVGAVELPLTDVGVASEAVQLALRVAKVGSGEVNLFGDENVPAEVDGPIVCMGSPTSNSKTAYVFSLLPGELDLRFTTKTLQCWARDHEYRSSRAVDFGVLLRCTVDTNVYFVCAGIDEHGTMALGRLLAENWKKLPDGDFVQIYKVDKSRRRVSEKLLSRRLAPSHPIWRSDLA